MILNLPTTLVIGVGSLSQRNFPSGCYAYLGDVFKIKHESTDHASYLLNALILP